MLSGITITCFAASYLVTWILEASRLFFRAPVRLVVMFGFALAGLFAHSVYLWNLASSELAAGSIAPLSSWYDWSLMLSWLLAVFYLVVALRRPENALGLFVLPLVLLLIGVAILSRDLSPFSRATAISYWQMIHGVSLLLGTACVTLGFAAGLMYLVQSYRLKHKLPPRPGLKLPSLEWLQSFNRQTLFLSTCLLAVGLLSGIILNLLHQVANTTTVPWTDPVVLTSGLMFLWLVAAMLFEWLYKPARQGRKVAYLTLASFIFLGFVLGSVLLSQHASAENPEPPQSSATRMPPRRIASLQDVPSHRCPRLLATIDRSFRPGAWG